MENYFKGVMIKNEKMMNVGLAMLGEEFGRKRVERAIDVVRKFEMEVPTWIFGGFGGGRFGEYSPPGAARNIFEKLDDASFIHKLTGATPRIATHDKIILADRIFNDAIMGADVRPLVAKARLEKGLPVDSLEEYVKSEYQRKIESKRG